MDTIFSKKHISIKIPSKNSLYNYSYMQVYREKGAKEKDVNDRGEKFYLTPLICVISCLLYKY
jgi:hypothetical protein